MLTAEQLNDFFSLKTETPGVECKGPGSRKDNPLQGKVIRAAIGMANRRDGGILILGMAEQGGNLCPVGLSDEQLESWRYEHLATDFANHAEPSISFDYHPHEWGGNKYIILHIHEFSDTPILCKKDYRDDSNLSVKEERRDKILRKGALYARSLHAPQTKEITTAEEMRTLLDLATEKRVKKFVTLAQAANYSHSKTAQSEAQELFSQQRSSWTDPLLDEIRSRGYWQLIIRPERFVRERIDFAQLYPLIRATEVNLRSHSFPYLSAGSQPPPGDDYVGADFRLSWVVETWRLYQSGQFIYYGGMLTDWRDQSPYRSKEDRQLGTELSLEETIYRCTEFFAFASRLALADAYGLEDELHIEIVVSNLENRALSTEPSKRLPIFRDYPTSAKQVQYLRRFEKEELVAHARELAFLPAVEIFKRFNWHPSPEYLQAIQSEISPNP